MASYWTKRRRVIRTVRGIENDILKEFKETLAHEREDLYPCVNRAPPVTISQLDTPAASRVHLENYIDGSTAVNDEIESDDIQMKIDHTDGSVVAGN